MAGMFNFPGAKGKKSARLTDRAFPWEITGPLSQFCFPTAEGAQEGNASDE